MCQFLDVWSANPSSFYHSNYFLEIKLYIHLYLSLPLINFNLIKILFFNCYNYILYTNIQLNLKSN